MKLRFVVRALSLRRKLSQTLNEEQLKFYGEKNTENGSFAEILSNLRPKDLIFFFLDARIDFCKANLKEELEDFLQCCAAADKLQNSFFVLTNSDEFSREESLKISPVIALYQSCERLLILEDYVTDETLFHLATVIHERTFQVPVIPQSTFPLPQKVPRGSLNPLFLLLLITGLLVVSPPSNFVRILQQKPDRELSETIPKSMRSEPQTEYPTPSIPKREIKCTKHLSPTRTESSPRPQPSATPQPPQPQPTATPPQPPQPTAREVRKIAEPSIPTSQPVYNYPSAESQTSHSTDPLAEFLREPVSGGGEAGEFQMTSDEAKLFLRLLRVGVSLLEQDIKNTSSYLNTPQEESVRKMRTTEEQLQQSLHSTRLLLVDLAEQKQKALEQQRQVQDLKTRKELLQRLSDFMASEVELLHRVMRQQRDVVSEAEYNEKKESLWKVVEEKGQVERQTKAEEEKLLEYEEKERQLTSELQVAEKVKHEREREWEKHRWEVYMHKLERLRLLKEKESKEKNLQVLGKLNHWRQKLSSQ